MKWTAEDIADANPIQPGQNRSKLDRILASAQANLAVIAETADELEVRSRHHVAAFFQLPFAVHTEPGWIPVPTLTEGLRAELRCELCRVYATPSDGFRLARLSEIADGNWPIVTQVTALFPVWGVRARFHDRYLTHAESGRGDNPIIVPQAESWIDNRPISLREYQHNMARRLLREITPILRCFLPAYSIVALREAPISAVIYGFFAMVAPGRLSFSGESVSIVDALLQGRPSNDVPRAIGASQIANAITTRYREFGHFEAQLFALERLRAQGETALALIGTLSLLEWVLNKHLAKQKSAAKLNLAKAVGHASIDFFTTKELESIDTARRARNRAVHESPPARHSLTAIAGKGGQELDGLLSPLPSFEVRKLIEIVFKAFREVNKRLK